MAEITIDGITTAVEDDRLILDVARQLGIDIPTFCSHPRLAPLAACRVCLVEVEGQRKLLPACATPVTDGMVVHTRSEKALQAREATLEFLLVNHPLDCPVCDQGGECRLQDLVYAHRPGEGRFQEQKQRRHDRDIPLNSVIIANLNRCIQCQLCVRYCDDIVGARALGAIGRGSEQIETGFMESLAGCDHCGNCVEVCPVGALMSRPYRYKARPWDLTEVDTTCPFCGTGCQLTVGVRDGSLMRVRSRHQQGLNREALCVRGRFGIDFLSRQQADHRLHHPRVRQGDELVRVSWAEAMAYLRERVDQLRRREKSIGGLISQGLTSETLFGFRKLMRDVFRTDKIDSHCRWPLAEAWPALQRLIGRFYRRVPLTELLQADSLLIVGSNVTDENPVSEYLIRETWSKAPFDICLISTRPSRLDRIARCCQRYLPGEESQLLARLTAQLRGEAEPVPSWPGFDGSTISDFVTELGAALSQSRSLSVLVGSDLLRSPCVAENLQRLNELFELLNSGGILTGFQLLSDRSNQLGAWDLGIASADDFSRMLTQSEQGRMGMLYVVGEDPLLSCPDRLRVEQALKGLELLVVQDAFRSETAQLADVILPALSFAESDGSFTNNEGRVQRVRPFYPAQPPQTAPPQLTVKQSLALRLNPGSGGEVFFPPRYRSEARADTEIFRAVAVAMGEEPGAFSVESIAGEIAEQLPGYRAVEISVLGSDGMFTSSDPALAERAGELSATELRAEDNSPPAARPPPDRERGFYLITGNSLFHSGYLTEHSETLSGIEGSARVELNDQQGRRLGVRDGDLVRVRGHGHEVSLPVRLRSDFPVGVVFIPENFRALQLNRFFGPDSYPCLVEISGAAESRASSATSNPSEPGATL